jgi:hypothetical protein
MKGKEKSSTQSSPQLSVAQRVSRYLENKIIQNESKPGTHLGVLPFALLMVLDILLEVYIKPLSFLSLWFPNLIG